jgi:2-polyprenyl-3-methyl-5-hydroxy-6-metoxy-1,4-benzoquinol methylase
MSELGFQMEIYDYFYHNNPKVFEDKYDFITTTEVIEHLHNPKDEIVKLWNCLKDGGILGIMTAFRVSDEEFGDWYYKRDLTHVRFFTEASFRWLAKELDAELVIPRSGVVILKKRKR